MKLSEGFHNRLWSIWAILTYITSFIFLTLALKYLQAGTANAIWAGSSAVLVTVLGIFIFKEQVTLVQSAFLLLIIIGMVGLNMSKSA